MNASALPTQLYGASPTKRVRRSKADIERICAGLYAFAAEDHPTTGRHLFYQGAGAGLFEKTEQQYKGTVIRLLAKMRRERRLSFDWIADNTRWVRKPKSYTGLLAALDDTAVLYRRQLWQFQRARVEVWSEKDAIAGIMIDVTQHWDVPLMVVRGYSSLTYLYNAAEEAKAVGKPIYIYYFGDHDPSGLDIERFIERELRGFSGEGAELHFERMAVTPAQICEWDLPTRPTKNSDSRSRGFIGASVDIDTITPARLRELTEACITRHIDPHQLDETRKIELEERRTLRHIAEQVAGWGRAS